MWGGAPRCDSSLAPGSASDWPTAGTDSRCEGESRTWKKGKATRRTGTRGGAPRCDFSLAPGSASDWPTAGTDSRCEGNRAPGRVGWPLIGPARGAGLRGATLLSHLEAQVTERQRERTPGAKRNHAPGREGRPHGGLGRGVGLRGATFLSHLEAQVTGRQRERTPGAKRNHAPGREG